MGKSLNVILAICIVAVIVAVASTYFYRKGQESGWQLAQQLIPLEQGELYYCVEQTGAKDVPYLTVIELGKAARNKSLDQKDLRFRMSLAQNNMTLKEYDDKYRPGR